MTGEDFFNKQTSWLEKVLYVLLWTCFLGIFRKQESCSFLVPLKSISPNPTVLKSSFFQIQVPRPLNGGLLSSAGAERCKCC